MLPAYAGVAFKSDRCGIETKVVHPVSAQCLEFKSDRCGIETTLSGSDVFQMASFKSDRCGIETGHPDAVPAVWFRSNQTVAGLKLVLVSKVGWFCEVQIRPLRD